MTVSVQYFAILKDLTGVASEEYEVPASCSGRELLNAVAKRHTSIQAMLQSVRLATDEEYLRIDQIIEEGMSILLIPPVSGG